MTRLVMLPLFAAALCAQNNADLFNRPPAAVDKALRARITEFFQDHVDGKFRQAEALVAEDTKEFFYDSNKPKYLSFDIQQIDYFDEFTRARATVLVEQRVLAPGFTDAPMKIPIASMWKLENGQWCWYVDMESLHRTPFGRMWNDGPDKGQAASKAGAAPPAIPATPDFALGKVKADKQAITLKPGESVEVTFSNSAPGMVSVSARAGASGVEIAPARADIQKGGKATLTFTAAKGSRSGEIQINIDQTGETIPIQVKIE